MPAKGTRIPTPVLDEIDSDLIEPERLAGSVIDNLRMKRIQGKEGRLISPYEALKSIAFEAQLIMVAGENLECGLKLTDEDRSRLRIACMRINAIVREAVA